jgi:transketolase
MSVNQLPKQASTADKIARGIRRRVLEHTIAHDGGYLSQACSSADIFAALYGQIMNLGPATAPPVPLPFGGVPACGNPCAFTGAAYNGPKTPHLDRFVMSPVHYALVLYAALVEVGRLAPEGLAQFNQDGSTVEMIGAEHSPGHEVTAGSLGQALSQAGGIALARRLKGDTGRVWVFMSDGEFQSGQTWETLQALRFHKIDNVTVVVDVNQQQCDGAMKDVMSIEPLLERVKSFGVFAVRVNGHDIDALTEAAGHKPNGAPLVILAYTNPCQGVSLLEERRPKLHYLRFKNAEERGRYQSFLDSQISSGLW